MKATKPKPDRIDAEQIQETLDSPGWQLIRQRIEKERDRKMQALVIPSSEVDTATIRGAIEALNNCLRIPQIIIAEIKETK